MGVHSKPKRFRSKFLVIILTVIILTLAAVMVYLFRNVLSGNNTSSDDTVSLQSSSEMLSSLDEPPLSEPSSESSGDLLSESSSKPPSSNEVSSAKSSTPTSSAPTPSKATKSSVPTSSETIPSSDPVSENSPPPVDGALPAGALTDWNLILLNPGENNKIDAELDFEKTKFDTQYVDSRAATAYQQMYDGAKKAGHTLYLRSGYRSIKTQQVNYNADVQRQIKAGYSNEEAIKQTNLYYTIPGHSEHHSGLAFDIITPEYHKNVYNLNEKFAATEAYTWLRANCANYGFVLRYPKDKKSITTINFEPWHYRYVGIEHAKYITANDLCLEEYIELLKQDGR